MPIPKPNNGVEPSVQMQSVQNLENHDTHQLDIDVLHSVDHHERNADDSTCCQDENGHKGR